MLRVAPTLATLGMPQPAAWPQWTTGERLDWLQQVIDAAASAYRAMDNQSWSAVRAETASRTWRHA
jgi:hypothetical protein